MKVIVGDYKRISMKVSLAFKAHEGRLYFLKSLDSKSANKVNKRFTMGQCDFSPPNELRLKLDANNKVIGEMVSPRRKRNDKSELLDIVYKKTQLQVLEQPLGNNSLKLDVFAPFEGELATYLPEGLNMTYVLGKEQTTESKDLLSRINKCFETKDWLTAK